MAAKRNCSGSNKYAFFVSCSSSSSAHVAVELDSIFASAKHQECGFNRAWQDEFPCFIFTTENAVKIRLQLQNVCLMIFTVDHLFEFQHRSYTESNNVLRLCDLSLPAVFSLKLG